MKEPHDVYSFLFILIPWVVYLIWTGLGYEIKYYYYPTLYGIGQRPIGIWNIFLNVGFISNKIVLGIVRFLVALMLFIWTMITFTIKDYF